MGESRENPLLNALFYAVLALATVLHAGVAAWAMLSPLLTAMGWAEFAARPGMLPSAWTVLAYTLPLLAVMLRRDRGWLTGLKASILWVLMGFVAYWSGKSGFPVDQAILDQIWLTLGLAWGMTGVVGLSGVGRRGVATQASQEPRTSLGRAQASGQTSPTKEVPVPDRQVPMARAKAPRSDEDLDGLILAALERLGGVGAQAKTQDLIRETGLGRTRLLDALKGLVDRGRVERLGKGRASIYRLKSPSTES